jgi:cellobiose transport system permease protein
VAPFFIIFGIFGVYPMFRTLYMSFFKWDLVNERTLGHKFIGLDNYAKLLDDPYYWNAGQEHGRHLPAGHHPADDPGLLLASALNRPLRARTFLRMSILIPNATSVAAVGIIFSTLYQRDFGVINWVLEKVGLATGRLARLGLGRVGRDLEHDRLALDRATTRSSCSAGMQAIPKDLYESAAIDGAGQWRQFWSVTFPMLRPTFLFVTVVSIVGGLQLFTEPVLFNNGYTMLGGSLREAQT